jgi:molybdopterin-guanine dinucleotide biosynthesis protein A
MPIGLEQRSLSIAAIILAGGRSTRMGQDKALLPMRGVPLLRQICETARGCAPWVYVVTPRVKQYSLIIPEGCELVEEQELPNRLRSHDDYQHEFLSPGPLVGFEQGLTYAQAQVQINQVQIDWVLLLACDLPYLQSSILRRWMQQLDTVEADAIALLPKGDKGWEPLCGFYRAECWVSLTKFVAQGGRSFQRWLAQERVQAIAHSSCPQEILKEQNMLFNCNTPQDWAMTVDQTN